MHIIHFANILYKIYNFNITSCIFDVYYWYNSLSANIHHQSFSNMHIILAKLSNIQIYKSNCMYNMHNIH